MTATDRLKSMFTEGSAGTRFTRIFNILESAGYTPLGKSNTKTLLYQRTSTSFSTLDVFAFRLGPALISFPKSYWLKHKAELNTHLALFEYYEKIPVEAPVSTSQYSAGQVKVIMSTMDRVLSICSDVCSASSELN